MVEAKELWFGYETGEFVLKHLNFTVPDGEIIGVLGANGVGKTTLLKLLAGILKPEKNKGEILFDGKTPEESYGDIAYICEAGSWVGHLTPKEYGEFLADFYPSFDMEYYKKLVRFFQLEEKPISKFSKGQKAKAEVAAGMAKRTKYIIMDEPFIGKDMFTRQDFMQALAGSLTGEETIFITTHEIDEIENFIDRALILDEEKIAADVTMDELRMQGKTLESLMREITGYEENAFAKLL